MKLKNYFNNSIELSKFLTHAHQNGIRQIHVSSEYDSYKLLLKSLKKLMSENKLVLPTQIPSISTGLFGYMGYEMIQFFENIDLKKKII